MVLKIAIALLLLATLPLKAEAAPSFRLGDRVLAEGRARRKCSATVVALPASGGAQLSFERPACGDSAQSYSLRSLQHIVFVNKFKGIQKGSHVLVDGFFSGKCGGLVKEISQSGYASVELDSLLCAESEALRKATDLIPVSFVEEALQLEQKFTIGQKVATLGINGLESCEGQITKLTNNGFASIAFKALTCAYAGKLYSLDQLQPLFTGKAKRRESGNDIFNRVMREIAMAKKGNNPVTARRSASINGSKQLQAE